jgi:hypothetical protein
MSGNVDRSPSANNDVGLCEAEQGRVADSDGVLSTNPNIIFVPEFLQPRNFYF